MACKVAAIVLLAMATLNAANRLQGLHLTPHTTVSVTNTITDGSTMTISCKSGDDDLGQHELTAGQAFSFDFYPNIWFTTLFFCRATWAHGWSEFDIYRAKRDEGRCYKVCMWAAAEDGIKGYNMMGYTDVVYNWNS